MASGRLATTDSACMHARACPRMHARTQTQARARVHTHTHTHWRSQSTASRPRNCCLTLHPCAGSSRAPQPQPLWAVARSCRACWLAPSWAATRARCARACSSTTSWVCVCACECVTVCVCVNMCTRVCTTVRAHWVCVFSGQGAVRASVQPYFTKGVSVGARACLCTMFNLHTVCASFYKCRRAVPVCV